MSNEDDDYLHKQTEETLKRVKEQMLSGVELLNFNPYEKKTKRLNTMCASKPKFSQNLIKLGESDMEFVNIINEEKPKDSIFDDICSICSTNLYKEKYICIICPNCDLCQKCEVDHPHPTIKCKSSEFSTIKDIYNYIENNNAGIKGILKCLKDEKKNNFPLFKMFKKNENKIKIQLECENRKFKMGKYKAIDIPITIQNLSDCDIDTEKLKLILLARNTKDLKVNFQELKTKLSKKQSFDTKFTINSIEYCKVYNFNIEVYCCDYRINFECNSLDFVVEVNDDKEEEMLNDLFKDYPEIITLSKEIKKNIKIIKFDRNSDEHPLIIAKFLKNNGNNIGKALEGIEKTKKSEDDLYNQINNNFNKAIKNNNKNDTSNNKK